MVTFVHIFTGDSPVTSSICNTVQSPRARVHVEPLRCLRAECRGHRSRPSRTALIAAPLPRYGRIVVENDRIFRESDRIFLESGDRWRTWDRAAPHPSALCGQTASLAFAGAPVLSVRRLVPPRWWVVPIRGGVCRLSDPVPTVRVSGDLPGQAGKLSQWSERGCGRCRSSTTMVPRPCLLPRPCLRLRRSRLPRRGLRLRWCLRLRRGLGRGVGRRVGRCGLGMS